MDSPSIKCVAVGDGAVGKSCMLMSYAKNEFPTGYVPTVFDNYAANVMWNNRFVQLNLWDTAGQEDYDRLRPLSYPDTDVFIACFSLVDPVSLQNVVEKWVPELRFYWPQGKILLAGTKLDLLEDPETLNTLKNRNSRVITNDEALKVMNELDLDGYCQCSAKTQKGLKELFETVIELALQPKKKKKSKCTIL